MKRLVLLSLAALTFAMPTFAQDDPRKAKGEALYKEAAALHDAGKEPEALAKWRDAYGVYPTPNILFAIAREEQLLGQNLAALRDYRGALKDPLLNLSFHDVAKQHIAELEKSTCRLNINAPVGATVAVDGTKVDATVIVDVAPGTHTVSASLGEKSTTKNVAASVGEQTSVSLSIEIATEPPRTEEHSKGFPPPTGAIILGGVGLLGLGMGVGFGLASSSARSDLDTRSCSSVRDPACADSKSAGQRDATISWISYIAGGALVAGGVVWWIAAPRKETVSVSLVPSVGPGVNGAAVRGTF